MKSFLFLLIFTLFTPDAQAQKWSPLRIDVPNYFLHPSSGQIPNTQECLSVRFDTVLQTTPIPIYRKTWPTMPDYLSRPQIYLYKPWHYFGTLFIPDTVKQEYELKGEIIQGFSNYDTLYFQPGNLTFYHPGQVGDTALKGSTLIGIVETKKDSLVQNQTDSIATIRLHGAPYEGRIIILSKNLGLLELPSFSLEGNSENTLHRHFEGPGKYFDFKAEDHPQWAPGDELHFETNNYTFTPGSFGNPQGTNSYSESRIVRCEANGTGGLAFTGSYSSYSYLQLGTQPAVTTTITDSVYTQTFPPGGYGSWESQADTFAINQSTFGKIEAYNSEPVSCLILPGNLALKYYYHEVLDAAFIPLLTFPPFYGGTLGEFGFMVSGFQRTVTSYPVFYRFGNDSAGIPLPNPTSIKTKIKSSIRIYPNPGSSVCFVASDMGKVVEVKAMDIRGSQIKLPFDSFRNQLDLRYMPSGLYTFDILLENGNHKAIRFSKE